MEAKGYLVISGKEALAHVRLNHWPAETIHVVQEDRNPEGRALIRLGAIPQLCYCFESPLYVPAFYDSPSFFQKFKHNYGYHTAYPAYFPSYSIKDKLPELIPWDYRRPRGVMVFSNKHWSMMRPKRSGSWKRAVSVELQSARYELADRLKKAGSADVFGHGWPPDYARPVHDKVAHMRHYQYAFVLENIARAGYITEKLIHAILAGCVPVYRGAPDIDLYIPSNCFVSLALCPSELHRLDCEEIIRAGREWLMTESAWRYSYEAFAEKIESLCLS